MAETPWVVPLYNRLQLDAKSRVFERDMEKSEELHATGPVEGWITIQVTPFLISDEIPLHLEIWEMGRLWGSWVCGQNTSRGGWQAMDEEGAKMEKTGPIGN